MSKTFEQGREEAARLCQFFKTNRQAFIAPGVKEAHIRQSLIDPFFEALGWDVGNSSQTAPQNREVVPEDSLEVEGQQKAPDYTFRLGRSPLFYAEAKKCGVNLRDDPAPAYQLRRYGWSAKVAVSILTDFEELAVYDCTSRPRPGDKAGHARILYFRFDEYAERWKELWDVFSREAAWSGAFDQYAASKRKRGTSEVDVEFLREMEGWREELARNIALRNPGLSPDDLNSAVQLTIDRVVFLRMAEDRGIEPFDQLLTLCEQPDIYARFMSALCRKADEKYNSGLFHFQKEDGSGDAPDSITPKLELDDKVFKPILQSLYFAHGSPYHFGVLPVEILGTVYERFLGKVIRLTAGHQAKVEEKPEVRKAGGVYYTPAYIVDYIVKNTIGELADDLSPAQLAGSNGHPPLRVLDMACGSGSFLLGAYQYLLDHALKWHSEHNPESRKKAVYKDRKGQWRLSIEEKKRILTTHIFGVDIDAQAVEVSKLSLLLKVLEGETAESLTQGMLHYNDRALPNLSGNIKCGNSLIGPDYFTGALLFDEEEIRRVKPFDWGKAFPEAMRAGGFDCVIGNPPYVPIEEMYSGAKRHYQDMFPCLERKFDTSIIFILAGLKKIRKPNGRLGFITSQTWQTGDNFEKARKMIFDDYYLANLVNLPFDVFEQAYVDTGISVFSVEKQRNYKVCICPKKQKLTSLKELKFKRVPHGMLRSPGCKVVLNLAAEQILRKCSSPKKFTSLGQISISTQGLAGNRFLRSKKKTRLSSMPFLEKGQALRYQLSTEIESLADMGEHQTLIPFYQAGPKILIRRVISRSDRLYCAFTNRELVFKKDINPFLITDRRWSPFCILGILNSKLISYLYLNSSSIATKDDFRQTTLAELRKLPIPMSAANSTIGKQAERMLALHKQLAAMKSDQAKALVQRQIDATDAEIDRLVCALYGLTPEEIALVEEQTRPAR
jgi:type I restriction-modification system DNA methylase subunit